MGKRSVLESELLAEVSPGHPLFGARVIAIARCEGCDEVLFSVEADPARFVRVHLTWRGGPESAPWPRTERVGMPLSRSLAAHDHDGALGEGLVQVAEAADELGVGGVVDRAGDH
jgi:hypothetical protein